MTGPGLGGARWGAPLRRQVSPPLAPDVDPGADDDPVARLLARREVPDPDPGEVPASGVDRLLSRREER